MVTKNLFSKNSDTIKNYNEKNYIVSVNSTIKKFIVVIYGKEDL